MRRLALIMCAGACALFACKPNGGDANNAYDGGAATPSVVTTASGATPDQVEHGRTNMQPDEPSPKGGFDTSDVDDRSNGSSGPQAGGAGVGAGGTGVGSAGGTSNGATGSRTGSTITPGANGTGNGALPGSINTPGTGTTTGIPPSTPGFYPAPSSTNGTAPSPTTAPTISPPSGTATSPTNPSPTSQH